MNRSLMCLIALVVMELMSGAVLASDGVQLWESGPYWAECNVGASKPEEFGYYFWWGDTVGYKRNTNNDGWVSVQDGAEFKFIGESCQTCGKDFSSLRSHGYIDSSDSLASAHDAATVHLGASWRLPTDVEIWELENNCDTIWMERGGVIGLLVKGRGVYASKSIFIPAAGFGSDSNHNRIGVFGYYWLSKLHLNRDSDCAGCFFIASDSTIRTLESHRYNGNPVRPVRCADPRSVVE